jgi:NADPH:quinone reductase
VTGTRAAVLRAHGSPPELEERPAPPADAGRALVDVLAVPITPLDVLCASGTSYFGPPALPYVPGVQGVGVVRAATGLPAGAPVWFATSAGMAPGDGSLAGLVAVPEADVVALEHDVPATAVAALGLSAVAAHAALLSTGGLSAGERVVVLGAGGVVGQVAVQLARRHGARRVVAAARSQAAVERATRAGADAVVRLDTDDVDLLAERLTEAAEGPVDLVLDPLWGVPALAALRTLRPQGRLVNLGGSAGAQAALDSATLRSRSLQVLGYTNNALTADERRAALAAVVGSAAAGELTVEHEVVPLDDVAGAWQRVADGRAPLRVVVDLTA